jgi:multidrug efflux pump subunit AcrB
VSHRRGTAGRLAAAFLDSRLTPLLIAAAIGLGAFAVLALPREEEPQIVVPMIDVMVAMPGASPAEVERRVTAPLERLLWEVPGVEYLYATSSPGRALVIVRFLVGHDEENALVRLNQKINANLDLMPPGVSPPLVKPRSIDDVPILALTLWSERYDPFVLRQVAAELQDAIKQVPNVSEVSLLGGARREVSVELDPARLAAYRVDPIAAREALRQANVIADADAAPAGDEETVLHGGGWLTTSAAVGETVVGGTPARPVKLREVATIRDGDAEPSAYVTFSSRDSGARPAVTITVAKRSGTNAIDVVHAVERKIDAVRGAAVPAGVQLTVTRNYGETAAEKSNELLFHMLLAVLSVSLLIWLALGRREAIVVLVAIPVTLALTLFVFYLYGYTLNRITLFALIFSIGILVDDAIVVVENIVRHARLAAAGDRHGFVALAIRAVDEVGNPTILATLTVVAAILPMAFVGGLMGPYMRPIPVGASAAMIFSLIVAFVITPWAAVRLLRGRAAHHDEPENRMTALYRRVMSALIRSPRARWTFLASVAVLLLASLVLVPLKLVTVKMLPFDNKSEFQVIVNMPEGTALERTAQVAAALGQIVLEDPAVVNVQAYAGTASPYNFNGLVRHYFLRQAPHQADLQVNLRPRHERDEQSHAIARRVRDALAPAAAGFNARVQVAEVPPGPPVLQTMVAEVYGPDPDTREAVAARVRDAFRATPGVVDVDWYVEHRQPKVTLAVNPERAAAAGVSAAAVASALRMAGSGEIAGLLHDDTTREDVPIVLRLPREARDMDSLRRLRMGPRPAAIGELTEARMSRESPSLYRKNLQPVTYVTGDLAGAQESPVYAILQLDPQIRSWQVEGRPVETFSAAQPFDTSRYAVKWDGEWHITYEVFRDLGFAFAAVLILIYLLVVGWFESFTTPVAIMAAIPFSLVGILPAHAAMGAFFTATSMIGFIAGAGIVVRNSIILVDFIELRLREGLPLEQAVVDAGAVRFRPMALTAAAVIVGSAVILFDPIFQGLAIALMAGEVASLLLSRMTVPVLYYLIARRRAPAAAALEAV